LKKANIFIVVSFLLRLVFSTYLLIPINCFAMEAGIGMSTSSQGNGGFASYHWNFKNSSWQINPGVIAKFSTYTIDVPISKVESSFERTHNDKVELGLTLTRDEERFHPFVGVGAVVVFPARTLREKSTAGVFISIGSTISFADRYALVFSHTTNFGLGPATGVVGNPSLFDSSEISTGIVLGI
jgi:hypothetical protein